MIEINSADAPFICPHCSARNQFSIWDSSNGDEYGTDRFDDGMDGSCKQVHINELCISCNKEIAVDLAFYEDSPGMKGECTSSDEDIISASTLSTYFDAVLS